MKKFLRSLLTIINCFVLTIVSGQQAELVLPIGHTDWVNAVCYTPDGKYIVTASNDNTAKLWEIKTGKEIRTFAGHTSRLTSATISNDGKYLLTGSADSTARLWDINTGNNLKVFRRDSSWVNAVAFSPDGKIVLLGSGDFYSKGSMPMMRVDNTAILFDVASGKELRRFSGHNDDVNAVAFSPDGKYVLTGSGDMWSKINTDNSARLWDSSSGKEIKSFIGHSDKIFSVAFSPDGKFILTGSKDATAKLWDVSSGKEIRTITEKDGYITSVAFSPNGNYFATGSAVIYTMNMKSYSGSEVKLWETSSGKFIRSYKGNPSCITSVTFSKDGKTLLSGGYDGAARMWDAATAQEIKILRGYSLRVNAVSVSSDGRYLLVGSGQMLTKEHTLKLWDLNTGKELRNFEGKIGMISSVCFSSDGKYGVSGSWDKNARLWEVNTGKELMVLSGHTDRINAVAISADGKYILTGSEDKSAKLWDFTTGKPIQNFTDNDRGIEAVAFSPDSKYAFTLGKSICMWDVSNGKLVKTFEDILMMSFAVSPDGKKLITGSMGYDGTVGLWDIEKGTQIKKIICQKNSIQSIAFSPDGKSFITGSYDRTIKQWDIESGKELKVFNGHLEMVNSVKFSPDGKYIISGSKDNTTRIWDVFTGKEITSLIGLDMSDWVISTPDNYYACSKGALDIMAFKIGSRAYPFEQFDIQYNRPDIVLSRMNIASKELVESYKAAYNKRLKQMNYTEDMFGKDFHVPEIQITNADKIPLMTTSNQIEANIKAFDDKYKINRLNVYVNEIPVFGMNGIPMKDMNSSSVQKNIPIELSQGMNKISFSCINERGVESLKEEYEVNYNVPESKHDLYFIAISSSIYKDTRMNLKYSVKDGRDITNLYSTDKSSFNKIFVDTLFNQKATKENFIALKDQLMKSKVDDKVILYASGHGLLDDSLNFYFATYDVDFEKPNLRGLPYDALENLLDGIPARKKMVLIDACHSGEVDKESLAEVKDGTVTLSDGKKGGLKTYTYRGIQSIDEPGNIGLTNSFELMGELFANLSKGSGAIVISAAAGSGYALESPEWNNGVFTYCILNGIKNKTADLNKDGNITVSELRDYVSQEVQSITKGAQKPTSRRDNVSFDFNVW